MFPMHVRRISLDGLSHEHSHKRNNAEQGEKSSQTCNDRLLGSRLSIEIKLE